MKLLMDVNEFLQAKENETVTAEVTEILPQVLVNYLNDSKLINDITYKWKYYGEKDVELEKLDDDTIKRLMARSLIVKRTINHNRVTPNFMVRANKIYNELGYKNQYTDEEIESVDKMIEEFLKKNKSKSCVGRLNKENNVQFEKAVEETVIEEKMELINDFSEALLKVLGEINKSSEEEIMEILNGKAFKELSHIIELSFKETQEMNDYLKRNYPTVISDIITDGNFTSFMFKYLNNINLERELVLDLITNNKISELGRMVQERIKPLAIIKAMDKVQMSDKIRETLNEGLNELIQRQGINTNKTRHKIEMKEVPVVDGEFQEITLKEDTPKKNNPKTKVDDKIDHEKQSKASKEAEKVMSNPEFFGRMQKALNYLQGMKQANDIAVKDVTNINLLNPAWGSAEGAAHPVIVLNSIIAPQLYAVGARRLQYITKKDGNIQVIVDDDKKKSMIIDPGRNYGNGYAVRVKLSTGTQAWLPIWYNPMITANVYQAVMSGNQFVMNRDEYIFIRDNVYVNNSKFYETFDLSFIGEVEQNNVSAYNTLASMLMWLVDKDIKDRCGRMTIVDYDIERGYIGLLADKDLTKPFENSKLDVGVSFVAKMTPGHFELYKQGSVTPDFETNYVEEDWKKKVKEPKQKSA